MEIEIPFGAKDSELKGWEYTIPEDMEAVIKDGKVIVKKKDSEDEKIRKEILDFIQLCLSRADFGLRSIALRKEDVEIFEKWIAYLKRQKEQKVDVDKLRRDIYQSGYNDGYQHGKEDAQKEQKSDIEICPHSIKSKSYSEQKSAEWSEKDKDMLESIEMWLHEIEPKWVEKELAWLKSLRPQPKKEWGAEHLKK